MKLVLAICLLLPLSSCFTQKSITKSKEPLSDTLLTSLRPGKKYVFHFNNGYIQKVKIEKIEHDSVFAKTLSVHHKTFMYGENQKVDKRITELESQSFNRGFDDIKENTNVVTKSTFNTILTAIPISIVAISIILITITPPF